MPVYAQYNLFGANVYMCYDYVHLDNLSDIISLSKPQRILVSSPQSAPVMPSLAMYRDPLTGPIGNTNEMRPYDL